MSSRLGPLLIALTTVATSSQIAAAPSVLMPQISSQIAAKSNPDSQGSIAGTSKDSKQDAMGPTADEIDACHRSQLGGPTPEGLDCQNVLQFAPPELRPTAEGTLLMLLGEQGTVTRSNPVVSASGSDADMVARQVASGSFDGNAAGIAARQRGTPAQTPDGR